ncbi:MAG: site-specific integrase [Spirochaetia bacterium]|jgi:integrase
MGRHAAVYSLRHWENDFWYYRLPGMSSYKTTGIKGPGQPADRHRAELFVLEKMKSVESSKAPAARRTLRDYSADFFIWDRCPRVRELLDEGKSITRRHCYNQRLLLDKHIFKDPIAKRPIGEITRADILSFRGRLARKAPDHLTTANKVLGILKLILRRASFLEDIARDPTAGVGNLKETRKEAGVFTAEELKSLFPLIGLGPWRNLQEKNVFLVAASMGLRRGEILALRWRHIDFDRELAHIDEAWKSRDETGTPKWDKKRVVPLPEVTAAALREFWERRPAQLAGADCLVFCYIDGSRLGATWWTKVFAGAMKKVKLQERGKEKVGIDARARGIKPHSFRHTVATLRRDAGEDPAKIRAALGWTNERTQDGYTHFDADMLRSKVVDEIWK